MSPLKLHCGAEDLLNSFCSHLDNEKKDKLRECVLKYTPPQDFVLSTQKINYIAFRIFNFIKSFIQKSEWQIILKETMCDYVLNAQDLPLDRKNKAKLCSNLFVRYLLKFHINSVEFSPQVSEKLKTIHKIMTEHSEFKDDITFTKEDVRLSSHIKCTHAKHSYWSKC